MSKTSNEFGVRERVLAGRRLKKKKKRTLNRKVAAATSAKPTVKVPSESNTSLDVTTLENNVEKPEMSLRHSSLIHQYLHLTVVPALKVGLKDLVKERPPDPLGFLAASLLKYKNDHADED